MMGHLLEEGAASLFSRDERGAFVQPLNSDR